MIRRWWWWVVVVVALVLHQCLNQGVLLLDQGVFAAVGGVAPDTDVCL